MLVTRPACLNKHLPGCGCGLHHGNITGFQMPHECCAVVDSIARQHHYARAADKR